MNEIIPAILVSEEDSFFDRVRVLENAAPVIQIDVMDGFFTANESWFRPSVLLDAPNQMFELHLMVEDSAKYVKDGINTANVGRIIWHVEADADHLELISQVQAAGKEAGLAISPETDIAALEPYTAEVDEVLVLGVTPGASGQKLKPGTAERIKEIRARWPELKITVDGGVDAETLPELKAAGASRFCVASAIFEDKKPLKALEKLQSL